MEELPGSGPKSPTMVIRVAQGCFLLLALWSMHFESPLIASVREEFFSQPFWGGIRFVLCLVPILLVPLAFLKDKTRPYLLWLLPLLGLAILLDATFGGRDPDEPAHLRMCWLMGEGWMPYRDFFTVRNLLWHALCIPWVQWMEGNLQVIVVARVIMLVATLGIFALLVPICKHGKCHPLVTFLVLGVPFFPWATVEFRADPPMTLLLMGSLWALARERPLLAGALSGVGYLMLQKAAIHGFAMGVGILVSGFGWRFLLQYSLGAVVVSSLHFLWAWACGVWSEYYYCTFVCSATFAGYHQRTPLLDGLPVLVFSEEFIHFPVFMLAAAVGCLLWWRSGCKFQRFLAVCLFVDFGLVVLTKLGYKNYLIFTMLLLALSAARAFQYAVTHAPESPLEKAYPYLIVLLVMSVGALRWSAFPPASIQYDTAQMLLERLPPEETYYGDGWQGSLSSPIFRANPTYYSHMQSAFRGLFDKMQLQTPDYPPAELEVLVKNPPGAFVAEEPLTRALLERMGENYVQVSEGVYLRRDLVP